MKRMKFPPGWLGSDLTMLPHESLWNLVSRTAWQNVCSYAAARPICRAAVGNSAWAKDYLWGEFPSAFLKDAFTYCPVCLEEAYHSHWFQFEPLRDCPVHGVPLHDSCMHCAERFSETWRTVTLEPYRCRYCYQWLGGAAPDLRLHLQRREQHEELSRRFAFLAKWRKEYDSRPAEVTMLVRGGPGNPWEETEIEKERRRAELHRVIPWPEQLAQPFAQPYDALCLGIHLDISTTRSTGRRGWHYRDQSAQVAYRTVVARIENWLRKEGVDRIPVSEFARRLRRAFVPAEDPRALALALMRFHHEPRRSWKNKGSRAELDLRDQLSTVIGLMSYRLPLSAWRMAFWATYANARQVMAAGRRTMKIPAHELTATRWRRCRVCWLTVPGKFLSLLVPYTLDLPFGQGFRERQARIRERMFDCISTQEEVVPRRVR